MSLSARQALGLSAVASLDPWRFAASLDIVVLEFEHLKLAKKHRVQLVESDSESWSGLTLKEDGRYFVVLNPSHPRTRQTNTLMHEVAHIQLRHIPGRVDISATGLMLLSDYPEDQEQEADWLAAALLLPRPALEQLRLRGISPDEIANKYGVSRQLVDWRLRMTGVEVQLRRASRFG